METVYFDSEEEEDNFNFGRFFEYEEEENNFNSGLFFEYDDNDGDDGFFDDGIQNLPITSPSSDSRSPLCQVITRESLWEAQRADLRMVMDLLLVKEHHARALLIRYQWNIDKLFIVFVEKGKAHLFAEAGVTVVEHDALSSGLSSTLVCTICIEDVPCNETTQMDCGHTFCNNCWTEYFIVKINDGMSRVIRCMEYQCNDICNEGIVRNLVRKRKPELAEKFDRFLLESYIEDNKMVKWCPSIPHCGNAIRIKDDAVCEVECTCGKQFCFRCLSEIHSPCSCLMWELWNKKCNKTNTSKWITVNTKRCPSCGKLVEKIGGCRTVHCFCGSIICWVCGKINGNLYHSCTLYKAPAEVQDANDYLHGVLRDTEEASYLDTISPERQKSGSTDSLLYETTGQIQSSRKISFGYLRYMHCYTHYKGHRNSIQMEAILEQKINDIMVLSSQENKPQSQDLSWAKIGVYRLIRSRYILSYSYVFAFYMFGDELFEGEMTETERIIKQNLFEDQQQQLEAKVVQLSDLMKKSFCEYTIDSLKQIKMQVMALTYTIDDLCKKMYDCIENDLLGSLQSYTHIIAPYGSKGVIRASDLAVHGVNGCLMEMGEASSCRDCIEGQEPSEKRAKIS
ncbi:probable E3 ubiquitin-protein ligase ARI2 [Spinacia oleracea]|uniref:RBR-type E3 ubiquitin transferase n=1 Tax=Spinacia oleracea TaxID=3562 RepID=A0A9R0JY71_SPIOL|nr:probable E3 ubiquitin-protein ligase ARI2 [Spinacia oleracea]